MTITQSGTAEDLWIAQVFNAAGNVVKKWNFTEGLTSMNWDGVGDSGLIVPDGTYRYVVKATDKAGNDFASQEIPFEVDTLKKDVKLTADSLAFSPNGDGVRDILTLSVEATASAKLAGWTLWISQAEADSGSAASKKSVKSWEGSSVLPRSVEWNGQSDSGIAAPDGSYTAFFTVSYPNGDAAETKVGPFTVDRIPPKASVTASAHLFSPNGDGTLDTITFTQNGAAGDAWRGL